MVVWQAPNIMRTASHSHAPQGAMHGLYQWQADVSAAATQTNQSASTFHKSIHDEQYVSTKEHLKVISYMSR
jgi:hypothetical protein